MGVLVVLMTGNGFAAGENLADGKDCELSPAPNYSHCTDPGDRRQLTDGETTSGYFWTQEGTVGWNRASHATVTVDLGVPELIGGVSLTTAAGKAGVTWPMAVPILVSDDKLTWREAGELVVLDHAERGPWPESYAIRRLHTDQLKARGRYVQFVIIPLPGSNFIFTDEIEVFRGEGAAVAGRPTSARQCFEEGRIERAVAHRWDADHRAFATWVEQDEMPAELLTKQGELHKKGPGPVSADESFKAIIPITPNHAALFALQGAAWRLRNHPPLTAWSVNPWDPMPLFLSPQRGKPGSVRLDAMRGETRAGAVNLANASNRLLEVSCRLRELPDVFELYEVEWTDTGRFTPVAAALRELPKESDGWRVEVLPGLVRQLWISVNPNDVPAGSYHGAIEFMAPDAAAVEVPVELRVRSMEMPPRKSLWVGGWSYTDGDGRYGVTRENREAFLAHLQERGVNAPWATSAVMRSFRFDPDDPEAIELDTGRFDDWIEQWPDAEHYLVFLSVAHYSGAIRTSFGGAEIGSDEFRRKVGLWITAWVRHLEKKGISPGRLGLLIHDEPHEGTDLTAFLAWARAIKAAQPEVRIWEDPTYREPAAAPPELFELCDILCPNRPMWLSQGESFADFYRGQRDHGKMLQFYSCSGPVRLLDPYAYYRLQAWQAWDVGATGSFFWAFGDNGGASSWNEYLARSGPYTPLFIDAGGVVAGKHMEAIRESVQDYETLVMLRRALEGAGRAGRDDPSVRRARQVLGSAAGRVLGAEGVSGLEWLDVKDRGVADKVRGEVLDALEELLAGGGAG